MAMRHTDKRLPVRLAIAACTFFFLAGQAFLPLLGIQNDEALFACAFLQPRAGYIVRLGHSNLPIMLMSYLGTLKAWIYRPVFAVFHAGQPRASSRPKIVRGSTSSRPRAPP